MGYEITRLERVIIPKPDMIWYRDKECTDLEDIDGLELGQVVYSAISEYLNVNDNHNSASDEILMDVYEVHEDLNSYGIAGSDLIQTHLDYYDKLEYIERAVGSVVDTTKSFIAPFCRNILSKGLVVDIRNWSNVGDDGYSFEVLYGRYV